MPSLSTTSFLCPPSTLSEAQPGRRARSVAQRNAHPSHDAHDDRCEQRQPPAGGQLGEETLQRPADELESAANPAHRLELGAPLLVEVEAVELSQVLAEVRRQLRRPQVLEQEIPEPRRA